MYTDNDNRTEEKYFGDLINALEEQIKNQGLFFKNKDNVMSIIASMKERLPSAIQNAYEICSKEKQIISAARADAEDIRKEAKEEAEDIIESAEKQAAELISRDAIVEGANEKAEVIMANADYYKENMYKSTADYVVKTLSSTNNSLVKTLDDIQRLYNDISALSDNIENNKQKFIDANADNDGNDYNDEE